MSQALTEEERQIRAGYAKRARELAGELRHFADQLEWTPPPDGEGLPPFLSCKGHFEKIDRMWQAIDSGMVVSGRRQFIFACEQGVSLAQRSHGTKAFDPIDEARRTFRVTHPEYAARITQAEWEEAIVAVTNPTGRAPAGQPQLSKWDVWMGILARIGLGGIDSVSLKRQYLAAKG